MSSTIEANEAIGRAWLDAFNAADLDRLLALYAEDCTHTSPKLRVLHPVSHGLLRGRDALRGWWADAFQRLPGLRYELLSLTASGERVWLEYLRHAPNEPAGTPPMPVAEVFDVRDGRIAASRVYHG